MIKRLLYQSLRIYQVLFSPWFRGSCRFYPSCSEYARQSLIRYPWWRAFFLGFKRILKCHPFHPGGVDLP